LPSLSLGQDLTFFGGKYEKWARWLARLIVQREMAMSESSWRSVANWRSEKVGCAIVISMI
jgi:hypothetical protein